uniref:Uncharacterized protein n=1 Tax=viral metagenome TaxID=1070528 RepID=A0A6C0C2S0_9ZZZZ
MSYPVIAAAATAAAITYRYFTRPAAVQAQPINYDADTEVDIYADCPKASFPYDKDYYLASDRFAQFIDETIASNKREQDRELSEFGQYANIEK